MNSTVTIKTTFSHHELAGRGQVTAIQEKTGMEATHMALLAKIRHLEFQQTGEITTMRVVTSNTIFPYRSVFPDQWPPFFRVAGSTGLGHRGMV